ncbi:MAG: flippase-like domain-containing protein, partial [Bacteroidaceae bacterium]|nr:flippase-like domain-containing protein [Bacteroidaceae bacterium]
MLRIGFPLLLAGAILYWMYSGVEWETVWKALDGGMNWWWMLLSMPFGISAQVFRAMRWKIALKPLGETPRLSTCCNCIFLSYASSLVVPRVGEVLRCGVLAKYENIEFPRLFGSVVSERVVDMSMVFLFSLVTMLTQIPVFLDFFDETGLGHDAFHVGLTGTGCIVAVACVLSAVAVVCLLLKKMGLVARAKVRLAGLIDGMTSVARLQNPWLFLLYSAGIWGSYYMHFYVTFYCMDYTSGLGPAAALVAFVVGCFAVLVPTPNGAGPWHFVVKTVLMLYGVQDNDAAVFVLIVHTLQTMLTV